MNVKKSLQLVLMVGLLATSSFSVYASGNTDNQEVNVEQYDMSEVDSYLLDMNFPPELVEEMQEEVKVSMYDEYIQTGEEGHFAGATVAEYNSEYSMPIKETFYDATGKVETRYPYEKNISASEFDLSLYIADYGNSIRVYLNYKWLKTPRFFGEDRMVIGFSEDDFYLANDTFESADMAYYLGSTTTHEDENFARASDSSIEWDAELFKFNPNYDIRNMRGYGSIKLDKSRNSGKTTIYGAYVHELNGGATTSVNVGSIGSITITGNNIQKQGTYKTVYL